MLKVIVEGQPTGPRFKDLPTGHAFSYQMDGTRQYAIKIGDSKNMSVQNTLTFGPASVDARYLPTLCWFGENTEAVPYDVDLIFRPSNGVA